MSGDINNILNKVLYEIDDNGYLCIEDYLASNEENLSIEESKKQLIINELVEYIKCKINYPYKRHEELINEGIIYLNLKIEKKYNKTYIYDVRRVELEFILNISCVEYKLQEERKKSEQRKTSKNKDKKLLEIYLEKLKSLKSSFIKNESIGTESIVILERIYQLLERNFENNLMFFNEDTVKPETPTYFYRGQPNSNYNLRPSLFREKAWIKNEHHLFKEIQTRNSEDFKNAESHLELLSLMQHYKLPTRLLDISQSPPISLFFAVDPENDFDRELVVYRVNKKDIKYYDSDTVEIISSLAVMNYIEKKKIIEVSIGTICEYVQVYVKSNSKEDKENAINEIEKEWGVYLGEINPFHIFRNYFVLPRQNSERIIRQQGAFLIHGILLTEKDNPMLNQYRIPANNSDQNEYKTIEHSKSICERYSETGKYEYKIKKYIIPSSRVKSIRKSLDNLGINLMSVYPELQDVSEELKKRYSKKQV